MDRYLPARGFERTAFLVLAAAVLGLKVLAIHNFRADSDETQHAHVVWGWVTGKLMYRDFFDNHMPLFQMAWAPIMRAIGERGDIMLWLRWTLLPFYFVCVWCVYRLTETLYSRRVAPWAALIAGTLANYFYTSTEFRTDQPWAALWLLSLVILVSGRFTAKRAMWVGLVQGLGFAVSVKNVPLLVALGTAAVPMLAFGYWRGERPGAGEMLARLAAMAAGWIVPPALTVLYFVWRGAFWIMYYCVIQHNIVPGLKRWGHISLNQWYYPLSLPFIVAYAWLIFRQTPDTRLAMRRTLVSLMPWCFLFLLLSYWPDITREDDLPWVPLLPISLIPLAVLAGQLVRSEKWRRNLVTYGLPAAAFLTLLVTLRTHNVFKDRLRTATNNISDVLLLTKPDDRVMDSKGDDVYRTRAYYWVLEPLTKARVRMGLIHDNIPARLIESGAKLCDLFVARDGTVTAQFIAANYVPFDPGSPGLGVLGKVVGGAAEGGTFPFEIAIPQLYDVVGEQGGLAGLLDGKPYTGPVWLAAGKHEFRRTAGSGRVALLLDDAYQKGFRPQFDSDEDWVKQLVTLPAGKKNVELQ
jgi:hypothetical protein